MLWLVQILKDDSTLKESSVSGTGFCVVMAMKVGFGPAHAAFGPHLALPLPCLLLKLLCTIFSNLPFASLSLTVWLAR
jgi:hypothetical protein